jgi:hypothetical protein
VRRGTGRSNLHPRVYEHAARRALSPSWTWTPPVDDDVEAEGVDVTSSAPDELREPGARPTRWTGRAVLFGLTLATSRRSSRGEYEATCDSRDEAITPQGFLRTSDGSSSKLTHRRLSGSLPRDRCARARREPGPTRASAAPDDVLRPPVLGAAHREVLPSCYLRTDFRTVCDSFPRELGVVLDLLPPEAQGRGRERSGVLTARSIDGFAH